MRPLWIALAISLIIHILLTPHLFGLHWPAQKVEPPAVHVTLINAADLPSPTPVVTPTATPTPTPTPVTTPTPTPTPTATPTPAAQATPTRSPARPAAPRGGRPSVMAARNGDGPVVSPQGNAPAGVPGDPNGTPNGVPGGTGTGDATATPAPPSPAVTSPSPPAPRVTPSPPAPKASPSPTPRKKIDEVASGPGLSPSGANDYSVTATDIAKRPGGENTSLAQILTTMPGVAIDQNQEIHFRGQHNVGQYVLDGIVLPLDMYADPSFISFLNPLCIQRLDLLTGILPAQYGFSNIGGVIAIELKDGADMKGGNVTLYGGQRGVLQPSAQYGNVSGRLSYYINGMYSQGNNAFSSATPGPNPYHDYTWQFQGFGNLVYHLTDDVRLRFITAYTHSVNQLPNVPGLSPSFTLAGATAPLSQNLDSYLNFEDFLGVLALDGKPLENLKWRLAACVHSLTQSYFPDRVGELTFQGVAATSQALNRDTTLQGDVEWKLRNHTVTAGFYYGRYGIGTDDSSLVFPAAPDGTQTSNVPVRVVNNFRTHDTLAAVYVNDLWRLSDRLKLNIGARLDTITGFSRDSQFDPTINLIWTPNRDTTVHAGWAHYMDSPRFQGFSPNEQSSFDGTTNAQPPGRVNPYAQHDTIWDVGMVQNFDRHFTMSLDAYYELNRYYSDEGQFGAVPIFVGFNYDHGSAWGTELGLKYQNRNLDAWLNLSYGRSYQYGVASGQYNFQPDELAVINRIGIVLDHEPLVGVSAGASYRTGPWLFSVSMLYSSGLRNGFDFQDKLPSVTQVDLGIQRDFEIHGIGKVSNRLTVINVFDRTNLLRPADGIGVFQAAYGPRFGVFDAITVPLH